MIKTKSIVHAKFNYAAYFEYIIDTIEFGELITKLVEIDLLK